MTRCHTFVTTIRSGSCTTLFANFPWRLAGSFVTSLYAFVTSAWQRFVTRQTAGETFLRTWYGLALFMLSITPLGGEHHTGRTGGSRMTIVLGWMIAWMLTGTGFFAYRLLGATWHRWIDDFSTTFTE